MEEFAQGNAAPSSPALGILGTQVSSSGVTYDMNGTLVGIVGTAFNYPALVDPEHPDWLWPTSALIYNANVKMIDGSQWRLWRPPAGIPGGGGTQISLRPIGSSRQCVINVYTADLDTPIWNMGVPPIVPVEDPPVLDPNPPTDPTPSPIPVDAPQPPPVDPVPPVEG